MEDLAWNVTAFIATLAGSMIAWRQRTEFPIVTNIAVAATSVPLIHIGTAIGEPTFLFFAVGIGYAVLWATMYYIESRIRNMPIHIFSEED